MPMKWCRVLWKIAVALPLSAALSHSAFAAGAEPGKDLQLDPAPCLAAAAANDGDKIVPLCSALIDNEKTEKPDRIKALVARAGVFERKEMYDSAISDYDAVLRLDPTLADIFNARGELWRRKGDRPKAVADFGAALRLNPDHPAAKANHRSLAQELEKVGALKAIEGKPSFNCATARRPVEKAICANPTLADLDREIYGSYVRAVQEATTQGWSESSAVNRTNSSLAATRSSAGPATTCKRPCANGCSASTGSTGTSG
jgi:tetratricopeptide (TPR) repeat protein